MFKLFKKKEKAAKVIAAAPEPVKTLEPPKPKSKRYTFKVAGISFHEDEIREELLAENDDYNLSKKDMIEMGLEDTMVYQYEGLSVNVQLVPEPDNPHDPSAIKVIADGIHVGYVPAKETSTVKGLLSVDDLKIGCSFHGGDYKVLFEDYETGKYNFKKGKNNIGAVVTMRYQE